MNDIKIQMNSLVFETIRNHKGVEMIQTSD
jgi:hypothetical protein